MWGFFLRFLSASRPGPSQANSLKALRLALYSRDTLAQLRQETGIRFDAADRGILHVYRSDRDLDRAATVAERFRAQGLETEALNRDAAIALEPALGSTGENLAGAIYSPGDLSGDAHAFTQALAKLAADAGVEFRLETKILRLSQMVGRIAGVLTQHSMMTADAYVCALGSYSQPLLAGVGIRLPIYPAKGYSVTVPITMSNCAPQISITDDDAKIVVSRLGDKLRIAGTAEFAGFNTMINAPRAHAVLNAGVRLFPGAMDVEGAEFWAGLRPLTPDGIPVIGATKLPNLFLNTGHGTLGWTMGPGSGRALAELIAGHNPSVDLSPYDAERF
jgi:D-amino-acid dehydrogenase